MKFIDLFAGLGGFHLALNALGHKCVFASEIDEDLVALYARNFNIKPVGDIKKINPQTIPDHDILCAGFPCQPFSKAGKHKGMQDGERGTLFNEIVKILNEKRPKFFILENVPFIKRQDNEKTWHHIEKTLRSLGYDIDNHQFSPHNFGIPQHRERLFIIGSRYGLEHFSWPQKNNTKTTIKSILTKHNKKAKNIEKEKLVALNLWQEFITLIPENVCIPKVPIWGMEYGATYPFENQTPYKISHEELGKYRGAFGLPLKGLSKKEQLALLPKYATVQQNEFPDWKKRFIRENRRFFEKHNTELQNVMTKISKLEVPSWHKLEWNVGDSDRNIFNYIIQFRASGIRVKNIESSPSLVCTSTQVPIIGWEKRYISIGEAAKLQSISGINLPRQCHAAFKALGNAVNVHIVKEIAKSLLK